jgi:hypothetical protein
MICFRYILVNILHRGDNKYIVVVGVVVVVVIITREMMCRLTCNLSEPIHDGMFKEEMEIGYVVGIHVCFPDKNVT